MPQRSRKNWAPTTVAFFIKSHDEDGKAAASRSRQTAARSLRRLSPARVGMALPGFLAVGSALGAYLLAKVRAGGGAAKRRRVDPLGAFVDATEVPATPASSGDGAPRALANLRYAVKDIFQIEGRVTGFGSPAWAETHKPAGKTARAVAMLADAGATCVGVTHMDEFAYGVSGENAHYGTPRNPAAPGRIPGGSSSGSAVAVAAALKDVAFALGTDSGGSVRVPAAHCGVFGFRPTHGAVSATGVVRFAPSMDTVGWFARDGETLRAVGDVLLAPRLGKRAGDGNGGAGTTGTSPPNIAKLLVLEDAVALSDPASRCGAAALCAALGDRFPPGTVQRLDLGKHLLVLCPSLREVAERHPRVKNEKNEDEDVTGLDALRFAFARLMGAEVWSALGGWYGARPFSERGDTGPGVRQRMDAASRIADAPDALEVCRKAREEAKFALGTLLDGESETALVLPTTPSAPPPLDADDAAQEAWRKKTLALTCICSLAGFPQVTLPLRADGIDGPRGVSLVMGPGRDYAALDAAVAWGARVAAAFPEIVDADATANAAQSATRRDEAHGSSRASSPVTKSGDAVGEPGEPFKARGNERFKAGAFEEAAAAYGEALRAAGAHGSRRWRAVVFSNRAMARLKLGAYAEAEEDCGEALKLDPRNVKAHLRRGAARAVSGNYLEALEDFESALRLEPRNRDARAEVSRMKNILGEANPIPDFD